MTTYPSVAESYDRLHRAGWELRSAAIGAPCPARWFLCGTNGENVLVAAGRTLEEAYWRACVQARAVGMLARLPDVRKNRLTDRNPLQETGRRPPYHSP